MPKPLIDTVLHLRIGLNIRNKIVLDVDFLVLRPEKKSCIVLLVNDLEVELRLPRVLADDGVQVVYQCIVNRVAVDGDGNLL